MLHLTANGEYGTPSMDTPTNHPVRSVSPSESETLLIGSICGALVVMACLLWAGIWYFRNQRGSFKSTKASTIEVGLVPDQMDPSPPSTIQRESETLKRHLMQPQMTVIQPLSTTGSSSNGGVSTPVYWSASQLLDNNNHQTSSQMVSNRGVNTTLDPISEEYTEEDTTYNTSPGKQTTDMKFKKYIYSRSLIIGISINVILAIPGLMKNSK